MRNLFQNTKICNERSLLLSDQIPYLLCSDGGLKNNRSRFGLIIQRNNEILFENQCRIPMGYENLSSGFGIISALSHSHLIQIQLYKEMKKYDAIMCNYNMQQYGHNSNNQSIMK
jgi:hypothetical protein